MQDHDAHLSDHEWKLKMAAEGKAIYAPGKTEAEVRAAQEARNTPRDVRLSLTDVELQAMTRAADEAGMHTTDAAHAFELLARGVQEGVFDGAEPQLASAMTLIATGLRHIEDTDGAALAQLGIKLGTATVRQEAAQ